MPPDQGTPKRESFGHWYKRKPIAWVGTGVAGIGLIGGVVGALAASSAGAAADDHAAQIKAYIKDNNLGDLKPCRAEGASGSDAAGFETACETLRTDLSDYDTDVAISIAGWALLGVGAIGTTIYALVDWKPTKKASAAVVEPKLTAVVPVVSPTHSGIGIVGTF